MVQALRQIIELEDYDEASFKEALSTFVCVKPEEEDSKDVMRFLVEDAIPMERAGLTRTYLIIDDEKWANGALQIDGYFSVALKVLYFGENIEKEFITEICGDDEKKNCPAYLIGQLARSEKVSKGSGSAYLKTALEYISSASDLVGGRLIYLDCTQNKEKYYEEHGFHFLQKKHRSDLIQMYRVL